MLFHVQIRRDGKWMAPKEGDETEVANLIEDWKSKFTDLRRTRYGFNKTIYFLEDMDVNGLARFNEGGETLNITRMR